MSFTSFEYLVSLPIAFILYWLLCQKNKNLQNGFILLTSLAFYGFWNWRFLGLLSITALSTYYAGLLMGKEDVNDKHRRLISLLTILLNLCVLFFFKYCNFFIQSFIDAFSLFGGKLSLSTLKIILPVGISFYTFTALSYSIDVYTKKASPTKDALAYFAYVTFFPAILSGPISRATKQLPQYCEKRVFDYDLIVAGFKFILWGLFMKLCVADRLGIYVDAVYNNIAQHNGSTLLFTSILYSIQIYSDFAGYSLIAIGSGKLFGINLQTNFIRPYFSKTVTEFWRRWHISLTSWFRDYIYFPLGGSRVKKARWMMNIMIVFLVSGIWHGAAYTFVIWGALHGLCLIIEKLIYGDRIKRIQNRFSLPNVLRMLLTFITISFGWIFFRSASISDAFAIIGKIFTDQGHLFVDSTTLFYGLLCLSLLFINDFVLEFHPNKLLLFNNKSIAIRWLSYVVVIVSVILFGVFDGGSFIYFQF